MAPRSNRDEDKTLGSSTLPSSAHRSAATGYQNREVTWSIISVANGGEPNWKGATLEMWCPKGLLVRAQSPPLKGVEYENV